MYHAYVHRLLLDNPNYWGKFSSRIKNYYVCRKAKGAEHNEVEVVISYPEFRKIIEAYYTNARDAIILGGELNLGHNLGTIAARRVERNHSKRMVNFHETCKQPMVLDEVSGKMKRAKIIYFDDDDWIRIGWNKTGQLVNGRLYNFKPTNNDKTDGGFKKMLSMANRKNIFLKYKYKYFPFAVDRQDQMA